MSQGPAVNVFGPRTSPRGPKLYFVAQWPESSLTFLVVNKVFLLSEDELRTIQGIFENNFIEKIFEIVQENTLKFSKLISFLGN